MNLLRIFLFSSTLAIAGCMTIGGSVCYTDERGNQVCLRSDGKSASLDASFRGQK